MSALASRAPQAQSSVMAEGTAERMSRDPMVAKPMQTVRNMAKESVHWLSLVAGRTHLVLEVRAGIQQRTVLLDICWYVLHAHYAF